MVADLLPNFLTETKKVKIILLLSYARTSCVNFMVETLQAFFPLLSLRRKNFRVDESTEYKMQCRNRWSCSCDEGS